MVNINKAHVSVQGGHRIRRYMMNMDREATTAPSVDIGFAQGGAYADGRSLPMVAAINEFGIGVPQRPFMRITGAMLVNDKAFPNLFRSLVDPTAASQNKFRLVPWAWAQIGLYVQGLMQKSITDLKSPPNAPATIARKGSDDPLIDTGHMRQSVTWRITPFDERQRIGRIGRSGGGRGTGRSPGRPGGFGNLRTRIYQAARFLGDIEAVRSGNIGGRFGRRGAGRFSSRSTGGTFFSGLGAGGSFGGGMGGGMIGGGFNFGGSGISGVRSTLYGTGKLLGDIEAVRGGSIGQRGVRRATGRFTGRGIGRAVP